MLLQCTAPGGGGAADGLRRHAHTQQLDGWPGDLEGWPST